MIGVWHSCTGNNLWPVQLFAVLVFSMRMLELSAFYLREAFFFSSISYVIERLVEGSISNFLSAKDDSVDQVTTKHPFYVKSSRKS